VSDLLVRLWELPPLEPALAACASHGTTVRRALAPEKPLVLEVVARHFAPWTPEVDVAFARLPVACFVAVRDHAVVGFACHDAIAPDYFGPTGVVEAARGRGVGHALALAALHALRAQGYAYAIVGGVGPAAFYEKAFGATAIERSTPGIYAGMLRR
jgi:predicted N-acetyltransferase YhbS